MSPLVLEIPVFTKDQVVSATEASKSLSAIRKRAKRAPQFIADHNDIDTVIIDYAAYEEMYGALQYLRELEINRIAADRVKHGPHEFVPFEDALTTEELAEFESMDRTRSPMRIFSNEWAFCRRLFESRRREGISKTRWISAKTRPYCSREIKDAR